MQCNSAQIIIWYIQRQITTFGLCLFISEFWLDYCKSLSVIMLGQIINHGEHVVTWCYILGS